MYINNPLIVENNYFKIYYTVKDEEFAKNLSKSLKKSLKELYLFYKIDNIGKIEINIYPTDEEFRSDTSKFIQYEKQTDYMVGNVCGGKVNFISPRIIKKIRKKVKDPNNYVVKGIIHEIVHIFNKKINSSMPKYINEGLATYLSEQQPKISSPKYMEHMKKIISEIKYIPDLKLLKENMTFVLKDKYNGYTLTYIMICYLFEKDVDIIKYIKENEDDNLLVDSIEYFKLF